MGECIEDPVVIDKLKKDYDIDFEKVSIVLVSNCNEHFEVFFSYSILSSSGPTDVCPWRWANLRVGIKGTRDRPASTVDGMTIDNWVNYTNLRWGYREHQGIASGTAEFSRWWYEFWWFWWWRRCYNRGRTVSGEREITVEDSLYPVRLSIDGLVDIWGRLR